MSLSAQRQKWVFLMDPLETVIFEKDTSFILMLGAHHAGHETYFLPTNGISLLDGRVKLDTVRVIPQNDSRAPFIVQSAHPFWADEIDVLFIRTDPPFNESYLMHTWLLDFLPKKVVTINRPQAIRQVNEKVWTAQFTTLVPATFISRRRERMLDFLKTHNAIIAKPTSGHGGRGVFKLTAADTNVHVAFETLSENFTKEIILQKYIPASFKGDKRILLLNGEFLGAVLRVHSKDDHRNNFFSGGKPAKAVLTAQDRRIIEVLKPELKKLGLYFVGIDILGEYLIEVNVTSPTGLQEINRLNRQNLECKVIDYVESLVSTNRKLYA